MRHTLLLLMAGTALVGEALFLSRPAGNERAAIGTAFSQEEPAASDAAEPVAGEPLIAQQAGQTAPSVPALQTSSAESSEPPRVDETALRYFAQQGDTARLEAEIARLRSLYPGWEPPADPLAIPQGGDPQLDALWSLYADGRYPQVREAIAERQRNEPDWQVPRDLLDRLAVAEARRRLVNASDLDQYETVVRVAAETPSLLTCADVDVLWRVARAFAETDRPARALDAYRYVLDNCDDTNERLATVQMASENLDRSAVDELLSLERTGSDGVGEFVTVRTDLARAAIAAAGEDPDAEVASSDVALLTRVAGETQSASDHLLLGWYHLGQADPSDAETAFRSAYEIEETAEAARGLSLALVELRRFADAEEVSRPYADESEDDREVYAAAAANLLSQLPPPDLSAEQLQTIVAVTAEIGDANLAQQIGWYAYSMNQFATADQWFSTALGWAPDTEPAAFGQALVRQRVGDLAALQAIQANWSQRSSRIAQIGQVAAGQPQPIVQQPLAPQQTAAQPAPAQAAPMQPIAAATAPMAFAPTQTQSPPALPPVAGQVQSAPAPVQQVASPVAPSVQSTTIAAGVAPGQVVEAPVAQSAPPAAAPVTVAPSVRQVRAPAASPTASNCASTVDPRTLTPETALARGWCLMEIDRPREAAPAFEVALLSRSEATRRDAAYGQSLAYLRAGQPDRAAVAATKAPQTRDRQLELEIALLTDQATEAFEAKRPVETLMALDARAALAPERLDLMVLRGYAYLELRRFADAERVFSAAARAGSREGERGVNVVREARQYVSTGG